MIRTSHDHMPRPRRIKQRTRRIDRDPKADVTNEDLAPEPVWLAVAGREGAGRSDAPPVRWMALPCRCECVCRVGRSRPRVDEFRWRTIAAHPSRDPFH